MRRRKRFDRGRWMIERERCRIKDREPPSECEGEPVGDILDGAMKRLGLERDVWIRRLENEWVELVGESVAKHARPGRYENGMLVVYVDSSTWLSELKRYGRQEMFSKLQARFGVRRIRKLVLSPDPD